MTVLVTAVLALLGIGNVAQLATVFTDAQWGDIQSFLNFLVLLFLTYQGQKVNPQKTVEKLAEDGASQSAIAETLVDAMEARRKSTGMDKAAHHHRRSSDLK